jgi:hypothetical protein
MSMHEMHQKKHFVNAVRKKPSTRTHPGRDG